MKEYLKYLKGDRVIWIITLIMLAFSLVSVYSFVPILVKIEGGTPFKYLFKHFTYVLIAFGAMFWIHKRDSKYFYKISKFGYYLAICILIFTFFFGKQVNGAGRWVQIPFVGLTFQSSDFAKRYLKHSQSQGSKESYEYFDWLTVDTTIPDYKPSAFSFNQVRRAQA